MTCPHNNFKATVEVAKFDDLPGKYMAHVSVKCTDCGLPMQFKGLPFGLRMDGAALSADATELRVAMVPQGQAPTVMQQLHPMHEATPIGSGMCARVAVEQNLRGVTNLCTCGPGQCAKGLTAKPVDPSLAPFKCPVCASRYFGPIYEGGKHVGRYCKGWPTGHDRSYIPCKGSHEERFEQPNQSPSKAEGN